MSIKRYFRPVKEEGTAILDINWPLSTVIPTPIISSVNCELNKEYQQSEEAKTSRGQYSKINSRDKARVAKYASENGIMRAVRHFKEMNLKEATVRGWKKAYEDELKRMQNNVLSESAVKELPSKKRGRPPLLGEKGDSYLQKIIVDMRERGAPVGTSVVIGTGGCILLKMNKTSLKGNGGTVDLNKEWAKNVLRRMGFTKRRACSKSKVVPEDFIARKEQFLLDIRTVQTMEDIPADMVINWDQTAMKIVPSCSWTMERKGTKRVEIAAIEDKRQITAVFACSLSGNFLPVQLIYEGSTERCLPKGVSFPSDWHITFSQNHWANETTMIDYVQKIIVPYVVQKRKELELSPDHSALAIFDVFRGQCTEAVLSLLQENNILYVTVPSNCTDRLQPLDLSVNKPAKDFMRGKFQNWYASIIYTQLENDLSDPVDMRLSIMKPLMAQWTIELYHYLVSQQEIMINGFSAAGITL